MQTFFVPRGNTRRYRVQAHVLHPLRSTLRPSLGPVAQVLAGIFFGNITLWDDPHIIALNPDMPTWGIPPQQRILMAVQGPDSAATRIFWEGLGRGGDSRWGPLQPLERTPAHLSSYVSVQPYTIGYLGLAHALEHRLRIPRLRVGTAVVAASPLSLRLGLAPEQPLPPAVPSPALQAWPFVAYSYVVMRADPGPACRALSDFWGWVWSAPSVSGVMEAHGFAALLEPHRAVVRHHLRSALRCGTALQPPSFAIHGTGLPCAGPVIDALAHLYSTVRPSTRVTYAPATSGTASRPNNTFVVSAAAAPAAPERSRARVGFPFVAGALAVVSRRKITLDLDTLARILNGNVTEWTDPAILALNPGDGLLLPGPAQRIVLMKGPAAAAFEDALAVLLISVFDGYTGHALSAAAALQHEEALRMAAAETPGALALTRFAPALDPRLWAVPLRPSEGVAVPPSLAAIAACASSALDGAVAFAAPGNPQCYALTYATQLTLPAPACAHAPAGVRLFVHWLYTADSEAALAHEGAVPLWTSSEELRGRAKTGLDTLTCVPPATSAGDGASTAVLVVFYLLLLPVAGTLGYFVWRIRQQRRALSMVRRRNTQAQYAVSSVVIPQGRVVLVDTDVEGSTSLWEWDSKVMEQALQVRRALAVSLGHGCHSALRCVCLLFCYRGPLCASLMASGAWPTLAESGRVRVADAFQRGGRIVNTTAGVMGKGVVEHSAQCTSAASGECLQDSLLGMRFFGSGLGWFACCVSRNRYDMICVLLNTGITRYGYYMMRLLLNMGITC